MFSNWEIEEAVVGESPIRISNSWTLKHRFCCKSFLFKSLLEDDMSWVELSSKVMGNTIPTTSSHQDNQAGTVAGGSRSASSRRSSSGGSGSRGHHTRSKRMVKLVPRYGNPGIPFNSCPVINQLTKKEEKQQPMEDEDVKKCQRLGFIEHLPQSIWNNNPVVAQQQIRECCICMIDFETNEDIRCLPCMHYYHVGCIDDWLIRSFLCPTCRQPVDAALLSTYANEMDR